MRVVSKWRPLLKILFALGLTVEVALAADSSPRTRDEPAASLAQLMAQKKWDEALEILREDLDAQAARPAASQQTALQISRVLWRLGRHAESLKFLERRRASAPPEGRRLFTAQIQCLVRIFATDANSIAYQRGLGLLGEGRFSEAERVFEAALLQDPDNVQILIRLAQVKIALERPEPALSLIEARNDVLKFVPESLLWKGRALMMLGRQEHQVDRQLEAVEVLLQARSELPRSELAALWLAQALSAVGRKKFAAEVLTQNAETNPEHVQALVELSKLQSSEDAAKTLRVALSRLDGYAERATESEGELGMTIGIAGIGEKIEKLLAAGANPEPRS